MSGLAAAIVPGAVVPGDEYEEMFLVRGYFGDIREHWFAEVVPWSDGTESPACGCCMNIGPDPTFIPAAYWVKARSAASPLFAASVMALCVACCAALRAAGPGQVMPPLRIWEVTPGYVFTGTAHAGTPYKCW